MKHYICGKGRVLMAFRAIIVSLACHAPGASALTPSSSRHELEAKSILKELISVDWNTYSVKNYFYDSETYRFEAKTFTKHVSFGPLGIAGAEHSVSYDLNGTWHFVKLSEKGFTIALDYQKQLNRDQEPRQIINLHIVNNDMMIDGRGLQYKRLPNT